MTNTIKIKRGQKNNLSTAGVVDGELKYTKDTKELFIGTGSENIKIGGNPEDFPISKAVQTELNTYLTKNNASGTYLSKTEAVDLYVTQDAFNEALADLENILSEV